MVRMPDLTALRHSFGRLSDRLERGRDTLGAPDSTAFPSRLHDPAIAARLGSALAVTFTLCFVTGVVSHYMQEPPSWASWPSRPINLYRLNQGLHVLSGTASVPLLLAKLWTVYPQLFQRPALRSIGHGLERAFVLLLVGGATFQLATGLINIASFYPFGFSFRAEHFAVAFVTYGALLVHVAHKIHIARAQLATPLPREPSDRGLTRRGFLAVTGGASALLVVGSIGQTVGLPGGWARGLSPFATHLPDIGPQSLPVRTPAVTAGVAETAVDPAYRLVVTGAVEQERSLSLADLAALPQTTARLPIACVEGWSAVATWTGVALVDLLAYAGATAPTEVRVVSLQERGTYAQSIVRAPHVNDPLTLIATAVNGEPLHLDHGYPCRLIAPNRPGVMQTKWISRVEVVS